MPKIAARAGMLAAAVEFVAASLRPAHRALHRLGAAARGVEVVGTNSSNAMTMSEPSSRWTSIERSGVSMWREPSRWLAKATPSSLTLVSSDRLIT